MKAFSLLGAPVAAMAVLLFGFLVVLAPGKQLPGAMAAAACLPIGSVSASELHLDTQQRQVAQEVIAVGKRLRVPPRGWVVALAAAMQESNLRPLEYGDRDSLGVFQQRSAWGSAAERLNPSSAARMFFVGGRGGQPGLLDVPGWQDMPVTAAAQAVQVSGYPDAYAKWEPFAIATIARIVQVDATCQPSDTGFPPLGGAHFTLTAAFGDCGSRWSRCHTGLDFAVPTGTPVGAVGAGIVTFAGFAGKYGNTVHVLHEGGISTWYAHLSSVAVSRGARVAAGQLIGLSGATGNTTGPHLHLEVRVNASEDFVGTPIDPLPWLHQQQIL